MRKEKTPATRSMTEDQLRDEKEATLAKNAGFASQKQRMGEMTKFLKEQKGILLEYDEQIVRKLIEKITVMMKKSQ